MASRQTDDGSRNTSGLTLNSTHYIGHIPVDLVASSGAAEGVKGDPVSEVYSWWRITRTFWI